MNRYDKILVAFCSLIALLCCAGIARGEDRSLYWSSVATLTAAHVADVQSSWGKAEAGPLLCSTDGRFGAKGVAIKSVLLAGNLGVQALILRKWPKARKTATIINFVAAGAVGAVATRNYK